MSHRSALVTGGTGFLGRNLVEELLKRGWHVSVLRRNTSKNMYPNSSCVDLIEGDLLKPDTLKDAVPENLDCLFHVAGDTSFWRRNNARQRSVNVDGTRAIAKAARQAGVNKFVHTSTIGVYGLSFQNIDETEPHHGADSWINYMKTKADAETALREEIDAGLDATIMNPCNIVGAYDTNNWSRIFTMIQSEKLPGVPPGSGVFCHAKAVAKAHINAVDNGKTGENYILGGVHATQMEFVQLASRILKKPAPGRPTPAAILKLIGRLALWGSYITNKEPEVTPELAEVVCAHQSVDTNKAVEALGYEIASLETMINDAISWMRAESIRS